MPGSADAATLAATYAPVAAELPARSQTGSVPGLRLALAATLGTRLLVWAAAMLTIAIFGENTTARGMLDPTGFSPAPHSGLLKGLLGPGVRWDSVWYLQIAGHGYFNRPATNFFPLYPLLVHIGSLLTGNAPVAGIGISIVCTALALMLLYRLARLELSESAAKLTVLLVALFPSSLFLSAVYPTSLFLLATVAATYAARRDRWALAGLCGGLAAATRSNGILVFALLGLMYLYGPRGRAPGLAGAWWRPRYRLARDAAWLALVPAGLAAYLGYLLVAHDAPLEPFNAARTFWGHSSGAPLAALVKALAALPGDVHALVSHRLSWVGPGDPISWQTRNLVDVGLFVLAVAALVAARRRLPAAYVIYGAIELVWVTSFPASTEPMIGLPRYMLPMFVLFMGAGAHLAERRLASRLVLAASAVVLVVFSGLWGYWALVP